MGGDSIRLQVSVCVEGAGGSTAVLRQQIVGVLLLHSAFPDEPSLTSE